jgi:hypothetical protein
MSTNTEFFEDYVWKEPYIQVLPNRRPQPVFAFALAPCLHQIKVPQAVIGLPFNKEIQAICRMFRKHQKKYPEQSWQHGKGFVYHRGPAATLVFDRECCLQEVSQDPTPRVAAFFRLAGDEEGEAR